MQPVNRSCIRSSIMLSFLLLIAFGNVEVHADAADTMHLTDEPGKWFCSAATDSPLAIINAGERVDFKINNCCTNTRHTVTLLIKPEASEISMDQDKSQKGTLSLEFDVPGVYVLVCKIHPYMTAVVAVLDADGKPVFSGGTKVKKGGKNGFKMCTDSAGRPISFAMYESDPAAGDTEGRWNTKAKTSGFTSEANFDEWYRDVPGVNLSKTVTLTLTRQADNTYVFDDKDDPVYEDLDGFFPVDGQLFGTPFP